MIENITIYCAYDYNANDAYFTNISLVLEPAETYSYDTARATPSRQRTAAPRRPASSSPTPSASRATPRPAAHQHRPQGNGQVVTMMRTTVSTQPQIIIVVCCITLRRSAYGAWGNYSVHDKDGKRLRMPPSSGTSTRFATVAITTTAKRASTTSRAGTTTLPTAGSLTPTGYLQMGLLGQICLHIVRTIL